MPRVGDDPLPRGDRSCGARAPAFAPNRISPKRNRRSAAQPARSGSRCRPRSGRRGPRARESMDKEEEREPSTADLAMPRVGDDPLPRGDRSCGARAPAFAPNRISPKRNRRSAAQPARSGSRCRPRSGRRGPRARESMDKEEERETPSPQLLKPDCCRAPPLSSRRLTAVVEPAACAAHLARTGNASKCG